MTCDALLALVMGDIKLLAAAVIVGPLVVIGLLALPSLIRLRALRKASDDWDHGWGR